MDKNSSLNHDASTSTTGFVTSARHDSSAGAEKVAWRSISESVISKAPPSTTETSSSRNQRSQNMESDEESEVADTAPAPAHEYQPGAFALAPDQEADSRRVKGRLTAMPKSSKRMGSMVPGAFGPVPVPPAGSTGNTREGDLLPVATQIAEEPNLTSPSVTIGAGFDDITVERQQQEENIAYTIPQHEKTAIADDSRSSIELAQSKGLLASEEERRYVRNMNRQVFSKDYFSEEAATRAANRKAKVRNTQGLQIIENQVSAGNKRVASQDSSTRTNEEAPKKKEGDSYEVGGYEVKEYDFGTGYQTSDYNVNQYKSEYD
jgi:hypothetical protein